MKYEELIEKHAKKVIEQIVTGLFNQDVIDVRFDYEDPEQWSVVTLHLYDEDKELSIRLHTGERYELYFGYYDDEDEFHDLSKDLDEEEVKEIPKGLRKALAKVLEDEQGIRLPGNFLSK
ncbi:MAG: hypothetical protein ABW174_07090 [Flavitalea sp.]